MKILHADDDAVCREVIRLILESDGRHTITTVADGEEAWRLLTDGARSFDVALIDVMMPRLDGLGLLERIRATDGISSLPVVYCTALNDRTTVARAAQLGVTQYIIKPYTKSVVLEKVHLIEAEVVKQMACEEPQAVAERLGVPPEVLARLVRNLLDEIRGWAEASRNANDSTEFHRLSIAANGFNGACLNLGLTALGVEMEAMETALTVQAGVQQRTISLAAPPEILGGLQQVQAQIDRVATAYRLAN